MNTSSDPIIFAHLHSSPLVVRRRSGSEWRNLAVHNKDHGDIISVASSDLEPVEIIDVKEERKLLVECLYESKKRIMWHTEVADLHTFRKVLSFGCRALHFSGHGVPGNVVFENKKCEAHFISQQEIKDLLMAGQMKKDPSRSNINDTDGCGCKSNERLCYTSALRESSLDLHDMNLKNDMNSKNLNETDTNIQVHGIRQYSPSRVPIKLVFLSACHSESVAEAFVSADVPHVVVVSKEDKVLDKQAMEFSKAFYTALFAGHSVARSFEIGQVQAAIFITGVAGHSKFKLLGNGDHSECLFHDVEKGTYIDSSLQPTINECDSVAEFFVGRSLEIHQVYKSLVEGARLVSIVGERGIGKTEVALQCAQYATERRIFHSISFLRIDSSEISTLVPRFARALHVSLHGLAAEEDLANAVRQRIISNTHRVLLVVDGCNRTTRQDPHFRMIISQLLRRVNILSILITGDGKTGAMDGVSEKIIHVQRLLPVDAALLFTLRSPRRLKAHEMNGSADLVALSQHPIIQSLKGHPRSICAVAQFLESKDMELDKQEFLDYIIPSVAVGLAEDGNRSSSNRFPILSNSFDAEYSQLNHHQHGPQHLVSHHKRGASMSAVIRPNRSEDMHPNVKLFPSRSDGSYHSLSAAGLLSESIASEKHFSHKNECCSLSLSPAELCSIQVADCIRSALTDDEEGRLVWANAVVCGSKLVTSSCVQGPNIVQHLKSFLSIPMEWLAPQLSKYFATKLRDEAVKRPLSVRSIDFLSKCSTVWGGQAPAQREGYVGLSMFVSFWEWFRPLTECIARTRLWSFTQPRLLYGFLSKGMCVAMLQYAPSGTFLIRFSETRQNCFVIAYTTVDGNVQFVPVTWTTSNGNGWYISLEEGARGVTFPTLLDVIKSVTVLKYLFPHTPKEQCFH